MKLTTSLIRQGEELVDSIIAPFNYPRWIEFVKELDRNGENPAI